MFEKLREGAHRRRILAVIVFGAIIVVFALFNYNPMQDTGPAYAARVNSQIISVGDYKQAFDQTMGFYSQLFGGSQVPAEQLTRIRQEVMDQLVQREAVVQAAEKTGFIAGNEEVIDVITSVPVFQENGKFKRELYDNFLRGRGMVAGQFEEKLRRDMAAGKIRDVFNMGLQPSALELERMDTLKKQNLNLEFARIETASVDPTKISNVEAEKYLSTAEGLKKVQDYHGANANQFAEAEQIRARHILIKFNQGDAAGEKKALERIQGIQAQLKTKPFEALAKSETEDAGSKAQGGDLGFFSRGRMVPEFENAAFALEPGQVSQPVKSSFGYHLIKLEEKKAAKTADFEKDKMQAAKFVLAQQNVQTQIEALRAAMAASNTAEVNKLITALGGKWTETGSFSLADETIPKLGDEEAYFAQASGLTMAAPLSKELIAQGPSYVVLKLKSKGQQDPKREAELATSTNELREKINTARAREVFDKWMAKTMEGAKIEKNTQILR